MSFGAMPRPDPPAHIRKIVLNEKMKFAKESRKKFLRHQAHAE